MEQVAKIREQLKRNLSTVPVDDKVREQFLCCEICGYSNNWCMITDEQLGFKICLGKDGGRCGGEYASYLRMSFVCVLLP